MPLSTAIFTHVLCFCQRGHNSLSHQQVRGGGRTLTPLEAACLNHGSSCPMDSTLPFCGFFWISVAVESAAPFVVLLLAFFSRVIAAVAAPLLAAGIVAPLPTTATIAPLPLLLLRGQPLEVELMTPISVNSCCSCLCSCSYSGFRSSYCCCCYYCWNSQVVVVAVAAGVGDHSTFPFSSFFSTSTASRAWILLLFLLCCCCSNNLQIFLLGHRSSSSSPIAGYNSCSIIIAAAARSPIGG